MKIVCTDFSAEALVSSCLGRLRTGEDLEVSGEGKYVSTVALAVATLKSEYSSVCTVQGLESVEDQSLTVALKATQPPERKKAQARARSFTTLRSDPGVQRAASFEEAPPSPVAPAPPTPTPTPPPHVEDDEDMEEPEEDAVEELTGEELAASMPSEPAPVDFHKLFHACHATGKRPPRRLFPKSLKAFSEAEAEKYYKANPAECVAVNYDLSDYNEVAWNYKYDRWTTPRETEHYENFIEALYDTKGAFMAEAVRDKDVSETSNDKLSCVSVTMQGWRSSNEDAHAAYPSLPSHPQASFFGVYDGHGGWRVADFVGKHLHNIVDSELPSGELTPANVEESLKNAFLKADDEVSRTLPNDHSGSAGSTVNCAVVTNGFLVVANAGDSRSVLCREKSALRMSHDHKPDSPRESERIKKSGSRVSKDARVEGMLAVSRALGDFDFKQAGGLSSKDQAVTAFPSVEVTQLTQNDIFLVQACDGVWDVLTDDEVVTFVGTRLVQQMPLRQICTELLDSCISREIEEEGIGTDNMTLNLVVFKH